MTKLLAVRISLAAFVGAALGWGGSLAAQETSLPSPDAQGRPEKIEASAFSAGLQLSSAVLSRTGRRIAVGEDIDGQMMVRIYDADTLTIEKAVDAGKSEDFNWFRWAGDDRLLLSLMREEDNALFWARSSKLLVFDVAKQSLTFVGRKEQGLEGDDVLYIDPAGAFILLSLSDLGRSPPKVWRIPLDESAVDSAEKVQDAEGDISEWWADSSGTVRLGMGVTRFGSINIFYRPTATAKFKRITKLDSEDESIDDWDVNDLEAGSSVGLAVSAAEDGKRVLLEMDYSTGKTGKTIFEDPEWDVVKVLSDTDSAVRGVSIVADGTRNIWFDPALQQAQTDTSAALGGGARIISTTADGKRMLVLKTGTSDPGALYVYTPAEKRLAFFANLRPEIDFQLLAPSRAVDIPTRDGKIMRAFLTLPRGRGETALPLVLMPHGGPYGVRDELEYSDWVQFLANRGYAVLQPNFRGSSGYGKAWEEAGEGEIGRRMQDDLDDAVGWASGQGIVDPSRVCIAGASYGGYAALWGVIRNPELYRCAISWAGVTDWDAQMAYDRRYLGRRYYTKEWREKIRGETQGLDLDDLSPTNQIARLDRPVLLAAGKKDKRVPLRQYELMRDAAKKHGKPIETLLLDDGHSLTDTDNEAKFLTAVETFLGKYNPAD